jgi:hypothetical protein
MLSLSVEARQVRCCWNGGENYAVIDQVVASLPLSYCGD